MGLAAEISCELIRRKTVMPGFATNAVATSINRRKVRRYKKQCPVRKERLA